MKDKLLEVDDEFCHPDFPKVVYKVGHKIGAGGFGQVYLVTGKSDNKKYVAKVEPADGTSDHNPLIWELT